MGGLSDLSQNNSDVFGMDTIEKRKHNITLGIAILGGSLVVLGTLLGELIPVMSIWFLNNAPANYIAMITLMGYSISQGDATIVDSQVDAFSLILIAGIAAGGILILVGTARGLHKGILAGTLVTFAFMVALGLIIPTILENLTSIPGGIDKIMYDATLSPSFTFSYLTPSGYVSQFLGGGYWLAGAGAVLGFLAWYRLSTNVNPEDQDVIELEKQVDHTVRHMHIEQNRQARKENQEEETKGNEEEGTKVPTSS